ncbi:hypothetical protein BH10ACI1_BH10ACI1_10940 [soil metagenome]
MTKKYKYLKIILLVFLLLAETAFGQTEEFNYKSGFFNTFKGRLESKLKEIETPLLRTVIQKTTDRNTLWQQNIQMVKRQEDLNQMKNDLVQVRTALSNNQTALLWVNNRIRLIETEFGQNNGRILLLGKSLTVAQREIDSAEAAHLGKVRANSKDVGAIEYLFNQWLAERNESNWLGLVRQVFKLSLEKGISSTLNFSYPNPQTTVVKIQPLQGGQIRSVQGRSLSVPAGFYKIWLERNGQRISEPKIYGIANLEHAITLNN